MLFWEFVVYLIKKIDSLEVFLRIPFLGLAYCLVV